jgi:glycosyltransferase involved in cell wall biosynthesis
MDYSPDYPLELLSKRARLTFVTNICPHYRVRTFETLAKYYDAVFYFFSAGDEWYWQHKHGTRAGKFVYEYLPGVMLQGTRITPNLFQKLLRQPCDVYIKCINGRFALPATYLAARLRRKPFILWTGVWMKLDTTFHRFFYPVTRYIYKHSDAIVTYGEHVKRFLVAQGVDRDRIFVGHHAVDNERHARPVSEGELQELRKTLRISKHERVILYLGRLERNKGLEYLIEAFRQLSLPDCVLVMAGEGSEKGALTEQVERANMKERVRFVGYVEQDRTAPYYALACVFVLPSVTTPRGKETWGLVVNEAMNQGCPVIATDAVGAAAGGLVRDRVTGLVVPERSSPRLEAALQEIIVNSQLRAEMSHNARMSVAAWDNERMVLGFRQAIDFVLRKRYKGRPLARAVD